MNYFERFPNGPRAREFFDGFAGDNADGRYNVSQVNSGFDVVDFRSGSVSIISPDPSGVRAGIRKSELYVVDQGGFCRFLAEARHSEPADLLNDFAIGLNIQSSHFSAPHSDCIAFEIVDNTGALHCVARAGGSEVFRAVTTSVMPPAEIITYAIDIRRVEPAQTFVNWYVGGRSIAAANVPLVLPVAYGPGILAQGNQIVGSLELLSWGVRARII